MNLLGLTRAILSDAASYTVFESKQQQQKHLAWSRALVVMEHINHGIQANMQPKLPVMSWVIPVPLCH